MPIKKKENVRSQASLRVVLDESAPMTRKADVCHYFFLICCESRLGKTNPSSILRPVLVIFQAAILYSRGFDEQGNAYI